MTIQYLISSLCASHDVLTPGTVPVLSDKWLSAPTRDLLTRHTQIGRPNTLLKSLLQHRPEILIHASKNNFHICTVHRIISHLQTIEYQNIYVHNFEYMYIFFKYLTLHFILYYILHEMSSP